MFDKKKENNASKSKWKETTFHRNANTAIHKRRPHVLSLPCRSIRHVNSHYLSHYRPNLPSSKPYHQVTVAILFSYRPILSPSCNKLSYIQRPVSSLEIV